MAARCTSPPQACRARSQDTGTAEAKSEDKAKTLARATGPNPNSSYRSHRSEVHRGREAKAGSDNGATSRKAPFTATQFHVLLTLSSKFFSNFHHCTCLLSVSGQYLALRGVYLALRAALSSNPTRRKGQQSRTSALRAYHPLGAVATVKLNFDWRRKPWQRSSPYATFRVAGKRASGSALGCSRFIRHY